MVAPAVSSHSPGRDLIWREWQLANRIAHRCEQAVAKQCLASVEGPVGTELPALLDVLEAARLREVADDLFAVAMAQTTARADANRRY